MASHGYQAAHHQSSRHGSHGGYAHHAMPSHSSPAPAGTFSPGTKIQVGSHRAVIQKYLSEGGFAHVYLVKLPKPVDGTDLAVLKRVAVPDKETLRGMRTEVETMKRLKGHRPIVTYIDSHASELKGGGYEVFLLMEFCDGGGLIDFMNTRLQHRLTEPEILHIFTDIAEGVACMHYLKPALLHRDLKVENVLIVNRGSSKRFKLCDFGSSAPPRPAPTTVVECRLMEEDVQKHTTLQYRSPEMIDVYKKQPLNEKADIWALGVLLYKLCYYTTPFEDQGQLAILNASFKYPSHPGFSERLTRLIGSMLKENIQSRPNIYQVLKEACAMQGREIPIKDIYSGQGREHRAPHAATSSPSKQEQTSKSGPVVGAVYSPPAQENQHIPTVVPMRRGRPTASPGPKKQDSSPKTGSGGDPFAALDSKSSLHVAERDELSSRFPTLDQFSLLHDKGAKFDFDASTTSPQLTHSPEVQRNAERLVDTGFVSEPQSPKRPTPSPRPHSAAPPAQQKQEASRPIGRPLSKVLSAPTNPVQGQLSRASSIIHSNPDLKAITSQSGSKYVSTGTMTSEFSSRASTPQKEKRLGQNLPDRTSLIADSDNLPMHVRPPHLRHPSLSSRPSLEDHRGLAKAADPTVRLAATASRPRPASTSFEPSTLDFLREKELAKPSKSTTLPLVQDGYERGISSQQASSRGHNGLKQVEDNVNLLDDVSVSDPIVNKKHIDIPKKSDVVAPVPKKLAAKFGDAFNRFEGGAPPPQESSSGTKLPEPPRRDATRPAPEPSGQREIVDGQSANALIDLDEDDMTPEMRREMERQKLEEEEKRVAAAQAEYRNRMGPSGKPVPGPKNIGGPSRTSSTIQSRMQSLLSEEQRPSHVQRTAHGYGKYTDDDSATAKTTQSPSAIPRKPVGAKPKPAGGKPPAPKKKPQHLNSMPAGGRPHSPTKQGQQNQFVEEKGEDFPGQLVLQMSTHDKEDYIDNFTRRFPSLGSIDLDTPQEGSSR